ncbi:MAG: glycogen synthase [Clostridiales bacterium]|nr:glycogen synthase [Clostridiales bacterium]
MPKSTQKAAPKTKAPKVLFVTTEAVPFAATGGMGEVCTSLPRALVKTGKADARVMLPLYEDIAYRYKDQMTFITNINVALSWRTQYCGLYELKHDGVMYYFVDNEYYFKRSNIYGYYDDAERFAFFSRAALELIPYLDFTPDVLQSNDHLTALVPIYYALEYKKKTGYGRIKNVFTIHNIGYQGIYPLVIAGDVFGISDENVGLVEFNGNINLVKGAITACDYITTMSPQYAREIRLPEYSCGLDGVLIQYRDKLVGILNGIDTDKIDPATSKSLFVNFDASSIEKKKENKVALQRMLSLPEDPDIPMICMVAPMVSNKGYDLLRKSINKVGADGNILDTNIQLVILGQGDTDIESYLTFIQNMYDRRVRSLITYNTDLAAKVLAGADMCLMPSRTEPCGLTQMMACRYGTVPIVRATGGLIDSIVDVDKDLESGNGFMFEEYDSDVMDKTITRAVSMYHYHKDEWNALIKRAMACDYSWEKSAGKYVDIYKSLIGR